MWGRSPNFSRRISSSLPMQQSHDQEENQPGSETVDGFPQLEEPRTPGSKFLSESPSTEPATSDSVTATPTSVAPVAASEPEGKPVFRKRPIYRDFDLLQLAAIFLLLDQLTKFLVRAYLPFGHSYPATGFFRFTHAENTGSAFGILQGFNTPLIFVSFVGIAVLALIYHSQERPGNLLRLSLALQFGGAVGNLLDRFRLGAVTDFIDIGIWPIFNLADASIVSGLALLGWVLLRPGGGREASPESEANAEPSRNYQARRRGRCAGCGRYRARRRYPCRAAYLPRAEVRHLRRRLQRR